MRKYRSHTIKINDYVAPEQLDKFISDNPKLLKLDTTPSLLIQEIKKWKESLNAKEQTTELINKKLGL